MKLLIIGHRGVGKSTLLQKLKAQLTNLDLLDLDEQIEMNQSKTISEIFNSEGEEFFRQLEEQTLKEIDNLYSNYIVSLGAGYCKQIPKGCRVLWVHRSSDALGRLFLGRPRLNPELPPLEEYFQRYKTRNIKYLEMADLQFTLPEGGKYSIDPLLCYLGLKTCRPRRGVLTLTAWHLRQNADYYKKLIQLGVDLFEIRDDILTNQQISQLQVPEVNRLYSYRNKTQGFSGKNIDWALELGEEIPTSANIISLHTRNESFKQTLAYISGFKHKGHLKLACHVHSINELIMGHKWWLEDKNNRSFLPRSQNGKYQWYRQLFGQDMKLNFVKEAEGSAADQPTIYQLLTTDFDGKFGAVLGSPVSHSQTPTEQSSLNMPIVSIDMSADELDLHMLRDLGLIFAAVTSPLKQKVFAWIHPGSEGSYNTLILQNKEFVGFNTDVDGLKKLLINVTSKKSVLWGGGGTVSSVKSCLPVVTCYGARLGEPREGYLAMESPEVIIWAVGRSQQDNCQWPPEQWKPNVVIDLNYTADSPGLEYAMKVNANYKSGLEMFQVQAKKQRDIFLKSEA